MEIILKLETNGTSADVNAFDETTASGPSHVGKVSRGQKRVQGNPRGRGNAQGSRAQAEPEGRILCTLHGAHRRQSLQSPLWSGRNVCTGWEGRPLDPVLYK